METLFWADQKAKKILERKRFQFLDKPVPKLKIYTIKTSASLSGVLHIGRLSDTIRGESVYRALKDAGAKARLIWVAEDMDPMRKVPKGVPKKFEKYIGVPVTDVPDPFGCHKSYAEHFVSEYFKVIDEFVSANMPKFSMRKEYKKGSFRPYIKRIMERMDKVIGIQNKYRTNPLKKGWSPWQPICENCGKIITPKITGYENRTVFYKCEDYSFEKTTAKGCGYEGENNPLKGNGKLVWKSEWAMQWAYWKVVSEGAGKEYQVPMSAWWVNAEIVEKIYGFPMPVPIFYEHILIDGKKMSASLGNVVYPKDWLKVAPPELLRFFYNKKLMKMRSFSWSELPKLYDDYQHYQNVYFGKEKIKNKREREHMKRLFEISQKGKPFLVKIPFDFASMIAQIVPEKEWKRKGLEILKRTGHIKKVSREEEKCIVFLFRYAKNWIRKYMPENERICLVKEVSKEIKSKLSRVQKNAVKELAEALGGEMDETEIYNILWKIAERNNLKPPEFFEAVYLVLLGRRRGPRLAPFIVMVGKEKIIKLLKQV